MCDTSENHRCKKQTKRKTHSGWEPEYRGTAAAHPERPAVWQLTGNRMTQSPSHPPPPTRRTSANKCATDSLWVLNSEKCSYLACFFGFTVNLHTRWKSTVYTHLKLLTKSYTQNIKIRDATTTNKQHQRLICSDTTDGYRDFESKYKLKNKTLFTHYLEIHAML